MKVNVNLTLDIDIDIDIDAWDATYGTGTDAAQVRERVRLYVRHAIQYSAAAEEGCILPGSVMVNARGSGKFNLR